MLGERVPTQRADDENGEKKDVEEVLVDEKVDEEEAGGDIDDGDAVNMFVDGGVIVRAVGPKQNMVSRDDARVFRQYARERRRTRKK